MKYTILANCGVGMGRTIILTTVGLRLFTAMLMVAALALDI
jgi:hypothetical protein